MSWLLIAGVANSELENELESLVATSFKKHNFSTSSLAYLKKLDRGIKITPEDSCQPDLQSGSCEQSESEQKNDLIIQKLRSLCSFWDIDPTAGSIHSHRKYLGPFIVKGKKALFSVLRVLLKPSFEKQRDFNAQVIELLAEMVKNSQGRKL